MSALDVMLLPVVAFSPVTTILGPTALVLHGLESNLFEHASNSCPHARELGSMFPTQIGLGTSNGKVSLLIIERWCVCVLTSVSGSGFPIL